MASNYRNQTKLDMVMENKETCNQVKSSISNLHLPVPVLAATLLSLVVIREVHFYNTAIL